MATFQSGATSLKPGREAINRGRFINLLDSIEGVQTSQTNPNQGSLQVMFGNRLSIQFIQQSTQKLHHSGSATPTSNQI